jgi:uncharacterized membrane protein YidH (DUF202 family)
MGSRGNGAAWASLVAGILSVATMPIAVFATRYVASYELLDSGYAIPVAVGLGLLALAFARRARRETALRLGRTRAREGVARAGWLLGIVGLCIASAAIVALAVYALLQYAGSRN